MVQLWAHFLLANEIALESPTKSRDKITTTMERNLTESNDEVWIVDLESQVPRNTPTLSPQRRELLNWFRNNAVPLAEAYEGAFRLVEARNFPGRVHFIAHAIRDIADRLVFVLDPQLSGSRVQYENEMDKIEKVWPKLQTVQEANGSDLSQDSVSIGYEVASLIDSLIDDHRRRRKRPSNSELLFRFLMRNEPSHADVNKRLVDDFKKVRQWFMDLTHLRANKAPDVDEDELQTQFGKFEGMLHSFVGNFFTGTAELDEILQHANQ